MADNVAITAGSGTTVATDEIGGIHYQINKLAFGALDSLTLVSGANPLPISGTVTANVGTVPVTGTFWQATQPVSGTVTANAGTGTFAVSAASLPLPAGASTETTLAAISAKTPALGQALMAASSPVVIASNQSAVPVSGTFWQTTQPVSGSVTANIGTTNGLALDATLTGGTQQTKLTDGTNVATVKAASTAAGATDKALVVAVSPNNSVAVTGTFWQATQPVSLATNTPTLQAGSAVVGKVGIDQTTVGTTNAVSLAQIGANTVLTGNGVAGTGAQRVTIASDNTAFAVNATLQTGANVIGALTANQSVNNAQIAGVATATGNGVVGTGVQRVAIASDNTAFSVNATATGSIAAGTADSGNPVKAGAKVVYTPSALTDGTVANLQVGYLGQLSVVPSNLWTATDAYSNASMGYQLSPGGANMVPVSATFLFNGTSWDRQRGMGVNTTTGDTGAKTATGNGATQTNVGNTGIQIIVQLGTVSGTSPTAVFKVQGSVDGGTTWYDVPGATTASLTATGNFGITVYPGIATTAGSTTTGTTAASSQILPRTWRVVWTIGGTTPSFTITAIQYNYLVN